ncbi:hypothetical protein NVS89_03125 [Ancylobacter sp. MQZ15Z-1]|uniref:Uncharacterized protein n=1 Tax=Ancylobacter mangrovi TaxID=2972472 RepID=A0A9X2T0P1_9HYPH|nr:hypothetical protein [Ancylobacter mangrovi]MCS0494075.1 hypothetical protein [Ancylobacter mangrovi]
MLGDSDSAGERSTRRARLDDLVRLRDQVEAEGFTFSEQQGSPRDRLREGIGERMGEGADGGDLRKMLTARQGPAALGTRSRSHSGGRDAEGKRIMMKRLKEVRQKDENGEAVEDDARRMFPRLQEAEGPSGAMPGGTGAAGGENAGRGERLRRLLQARRAEAGEETTEETGGRGERLRRLMEARRANGGGTADGSNEGRGERLKLLLQVLRDKRDA